MFCLFKRHEIYRKQTLNSWPNKINKTVLYLKEKCKSLNILQTNKNVIVCIDLEILITNMEMERHKKQ